MVRRINAFVAATAAMLAPVALAAQYPFEGTSASADEILALLESRLDTRSPWPYDSALERAGWHAALFLTQFTGPSENPEHFGLRSRAELDVFADTLVAIAVAHPESRTTLAIGNAFLDSAIEGQPDRTAYAGAFDALERLVRAGAERTHHLIGVDPRRGVAVAMDMLEAGNLTYPCAFLYEAASYGEVTVSDGGLAFEFNGNADLFVGSFDRSRRPVLPPDNAWRVEAKGRQLHEAGYLEAPDPCRIWEGRIELAPGQTPAATETEAMAALRGEDPDEPLGALAFINGIGWRASDELKAVFLDAAWRHMRQLDVEPSHYGGETWSYITVTIRTHDPAGIPLLVEHALGVTGEVVTNALADFGVAALPTLLDYVRPTGPPGDARVLRVGSGLRTLALIAEDGPIPPDMRPCAIEAARNRLTAAPQERYVVARAMELAVALGDPGLRALVEDLTDFRSVGDLTGGFADHEYLHTLARDLLAGIVPQGKFRKRCPLGDCPAGW
ncbi:MAG: hypothetical protein F4Y07_15800 [Gemmatimonadetes bacterium]|nr:hypothetical protein [Gemmatimonadota bacterium]MYE17933.1 hypothetical protein [Gemmatimonadota bacterium]